MVANTVLHYRAAQLVIGCSCTVAEILSSDKKEIHIKLNLCRMRLPDKNIRIFIRAWFFSSLVLQSRIQQWA